MDEIHHQPDHNLPFVVWYQPTNKIVDPVQELHSGDLCPQCQIGRLDYDGTLNLACNQCKFSLSGGSGCT